MMRPGRNSCGWYNMKRFWKHQLSAFQYALAEKRPALFMDMRLGKNLVVIRRVKLIKGSDNRILIVCPSSAFDSWRDELEGEGEVYRMLTGSRGDRLKALDSLEGEEGRRWAIINKEGYISLPEIARIDWAVIVLDESHFIKNPKAKVTKFFLDNFKMTKHKWLLTGTPNPEGDLDMICQLLFLDGEVLGKRDYWKFRNQYCRPDNYGWIMDPKAKTALREYIGKRCFILRRKDAGMDREKIYAKRIVQFPPDLRKSYDMAEKEFALSYAGHEKQTLWSIGKYVWLRRLCGGFIDDSLIWDGKINELRYLLQTELKNESVVVWFSFNEEIKAIKRAIAKESWAEITGDTKLDMRSSYIKSFNDGNIRILLMQIAVAETGLNLSKADTAIYYSNPTGLKARKQSEDRILHLEKSGPLLYIDLMVENSIDIDLSNALKIKGLESDVSLSRAIREGMKERTK